MTTKESPNSVNPESSSNDYIRVQFYGLFEALRKVPSKFDERFNKDPRGGKLSKIPLRINKSAGLYQALQQNLIIRGFDASDIPALALYVKGMRLKQKDTAESANVNE